LTHRTVLRIVRVATGGRTGRVRFVRAGLASGARIGGHVSRTTCSRIRLVRNGRWQRVARPQMQRLAANGHYRIDGQSPESNQSVPDAHTKMPVCPSQRKSSWSDQLRILFALRKSSSRGQVDRPQKNVGPACRSAATENSSRSDLVNVPAGFNPRWEFVRDVSVA
jgi:hypothetical protein